MLISKRFVKLSKADFPGLRAGETEARVASLGQSEKPDVLRCESCTGFTGLCCVPSHKGAEHHTVGHRAP